MVSFVRVVVVRRLRDKLAVLHDVVVVGLVVVGVLRKSLFQKGLGVIH